MFSHSKDVLFPRESVRDCGKDFFPFISWPYCFCMIAFEELVMNVSFGLHGNILGAFPVI